MITQWDIISNLSPNDNSIRHTLLIDGTEHDARLIAKKLQGYVQAPQPALAPYVYRFGLPADLDENTLEKIRVAVREGIEQVKKVNEFIPGGSLGNPLFTENAAKEDKDFPTFITLDPSESFFSAGRTIPSKPEPPQVEEFEQKQIHIEPEEEIPAHAQTLEELDQPGYRSDPQPPQPPFQREENPLSEPEEEPSAEEALTSVEAQDEAWPDDPPASSSGETENLHIQAQSVQPDELPSEMTPSAPVPETNEENSSPLTERDMLNKDMEGTLLDPALEDIFSAETKYDMFLDVDKLEGKNPLPAKRDLAPDAVAAGPEAVCSASSEEDNAGGFNVFDQKIKDQTCFVDLDDIYSVTERITQKDLEFIRHAQVPEADKQASLSADADKQPDLDGLAVEKIPAEPAVVEERQTPESEQNQGLFISQPEDSAPQEEVMDPFEQMLAAGRQKQEDAGQTDLQAQPEAQDAPSRDNTTEEEPTQQPTTPPATPAPEPDAPATLNTEQALRVTPAPQAPITENIMEENTGDRKTFLHLKRKIQTPAPQAPIAPQAPQKPAQPDVPQQAEAPSAPVPSAQPLPEKETSAGTTILRRRMPPAPGNTVLEKTRTIDHSIELPLSALQKHNWPLEVPLVPTYTLENMTISVNRFAHATAISVIDNPGKLYNPLVLHGASGTGKTHFLHAIGYALSKKYGQENIFITNGVRLSRGVQRYVIENNMDKFRQFADSAKALLIDDIHLIAVNEQNRAHLSKLLNDFKQQNKQIVITSKYPPESLAKLEELFKFRLDSGWISELKDATEPTRTRIIQKILMSNGINVTDDDTHRFFGHANMSLGTVARSIRRVRVLEKLVFPNAPQAQRSELAIFEKLLATNGEDPNSLLTQKSPEEITSAPVVGNGEWGRIGFFYPQNHSDMMNWLVFALQQRAKELGIPGGPELAVRSSYSTDNIISSAFKIANLCDNKKLKGAVILGPEVMVCDPSVRENFYDILTHMLEIMLIRCGILNYEDYSSPSTYVKVLSELLR